MTQRIAKLEALLARIKANATAPRAEPAPGVSLAATPIAGGPAVVEPEAVEPEAAAQERTDDWTEVTSRVQVNQEREVEAPLESRARLVAAPAVDVVEEIEADDVLELDDRHVVPDALAMTMEAKSPLEVSATPEPEDDGPPPSSRRPITEPAETPQEAQIKVTHTPPPESGKQVATDSLSFDDDFTGVREAQPVKVAVPEPSIQLQSLRSPAVQEPAPVDEMEVQLPSAPTATGGTSEATRPPPGPLPNLQPPRAPSMDPPQAGHRIPGPMPEPSSTLTLDVPASPEVTRPTRPVAAAHVAEMAQAMAVAAPKTFGELIDLALSL